MNLLKIILIAFAIYFIRRMFQLYKFVKIQNQEIQNLKEKFDKQGNSNTQNEQSIKAEYKVID